LGSKPFSRSSGRHRGRNWYPVSGLGVDPQPRPFAPENGPRSGSYRDAATVERILGNSDFVEQVLSEAKEHLERKYLLQAQGIDENQLIEIVARVLGVEPWQVCAAGKQRGRVRARSLFCYWAVRVLGMTMTALSGNLNLSPGGISLSVKRGEEIARSGGYELERQLNIQNYRSSSFSTSWIFFKST